MSGSESLYQLVYTSVLAMDASVSCVADICHVSRARNKQESLTGLLVFDGLRFCQYLEGTRDKVRALAQSICEDVRHEQFMILHEGEFDGPRLFRDWSMGYAIIDDEELLSSVFAQRGVASVEALRGLVPRLDLQP